MTAFIRPANALRGIPKLIKGTSQTDYDNPVVLVDENVPAGKTWFLTHVFASCAQQGCLEIEVDGDVVGTGRVQPGNPNVYYPWHPAMKAVEGKNVKLTWTGTASRKPGRVDAFIHLSEA